MRKLIFAMHTTLDGYVAGPNGEMDWINLPVELFDFVEKLTDAADTAMYGRKTFEMMNYYWPTAGDKPDATKHDKEHSAWYTKVKKIVLSNSMQGKDTDDIRFIAGNLTKEIDDIKKQAGKNILIFGSPSSVHALIAENLIDEFYLFVNPVLLGQGIPLFDNLKQRTNLKLLSSKTYSPEGVVCLHYLNA